MKAVTILAVIGCLAAGFLAWQPDDGPTRIEIGPSGVSVADLAKADWDQVCFYPQFSLPETMNASRSYDACPIWSDVEERKTLIVFSSPNGCESFGVEGDFLSEYFEEVRCFSAEEMARTRLVKQAEAIRLIEE